MLALILRSTVVATVVRLAERESVSLSRSSAVRPHFFARPSRTAPGLGEQYATAFAIDW